MKINEKLQTIVDYFDSNRQRGHTGAALMGVCNTKDAKLLVETPRQAKKYSNVIPLTESSLRGRNNPIVLDNALVYSLCKDALAEINRLTEYNVHLLHDLTNAS